jgi:ADP-dependent NAD(P)H-hydrate dehydratase / NAD(P)H-hydrate epimerase
MIANYLYTTAQVRALDQNAINELGIPGPVLMQRAAQAASGVLRARWPQARGIAVLCGSGNNGGDGFLLAKIARESGMNVTVVALGAAETTDDAGKARSEWLATGGEILPPASLPEDADVYVDALFGTGLSRAVDGMAEKLIGRVNAFQRPVLALDVPSGLNADTGGVLGVAVRAQATITFVAHKRGLFTGAAPAYCGEVILDRLDLPDAMYTSSQPDAKLLDVDGMTSWLPPRARDANKGNCGHVLAIGGDHGMGGAIRLAGEAALRVGAGLVSVATRANHVSALNAARPELMAHGADTAQDLEPLIKGASVIALGPGLGQGAWSQELWHAALAAGLPTLVDADALNLLAHTAVSLPAQTVITPHPGEAARLLDTDVAHVMRDRFAAARELARRYAAVAVLKGAGSLIAGPGGEVCVCPWGNPGMASGGMGDVLTGVIAGLLAQGLEPWRAACLGVALHARAGDVAAISGQAGLLASDLFEPLRSLRNA